jgi:hypothetical protein
MPFIVLKKSKILSSFLPLATWTSLFRYYVSGLQCQNIQLTMPDLKIVWILSLIFNEWSYRLVSTCIDHIFMSDV